MTNKEIFKLAKSLTKEKITAQVEAWEAAGRNEEIKTFETLVRLGDPEGLAMATTIAELINKSGHDESLYRLAYES